VFFHLRLLMMLRGVKRGMIVVLRYVHVACEIVKDCLPLRVRQPCGLLYVNVGRDFILTMAFESVCVNRKTGWGCGAEVLRKRIIEAGVDKCV